MPLAERDSNGSGRNSRASNMSAGSRNMAPKGPPPARNNDYLSYAPGVASMLRTSTELGNLGGIAYDTSATMPHVPRAPPRSGAASRMSTTSSHSNASRRDSRPRSAQHHAWPSGSSAARQSTTRNMPDYVADTLSPTVMNLPGSSPLIPHSQSSRDGRSRSMTHASHPNMTLSSNRSYSSLQGQDMSQRPRSPFDASSQQYRRPRGLRPVSPAVSDYTDSRPRRWPGDQPLPRQRGAPSDMQSRNGHRSQLGQMMPPPLRTRSPAAAAYYANPDFHIGVPPVPQIPSHHRHRAVSHARITHKQVRGSTSSGFTSHRADSAPSSDEPSPPTPKDGPLMGTLVSPTGARMLIESSTVDYYDGSEEFFEREELQATATEHDTVLTGYACNIKTIVEERGPLETPLDATVAIAKKEEVETVEVELGGMAELPASPVARRITRDLVLAALGDAASSTDNAGTSTGSPKAESMAEAAAKRESDEAVPGVGKQEIGPGILRPHQERKEEVRMSVMSAASALVDSSTVELAIRFTSPGLSGMPSTSENVTTEDGMSELLEGYQHTEMREDESEMIDDESPVELVVQKKSSQHTPKSSGAQSFKSCTDQTEQPCKDSDAKSFRTCKGAVTPDLAGVRTSKDVNTPNRTVSLPTARLPSTSVARSEPPMQRPASEMPLSSPPTAVRSRPRRSLRDASFSRIISRNRANSKLSSRNGSTATAVTGTSISSVEGSLIHQPVVPPRESSSSREAHNMMGVRNFLMMQIRPRHRRSGMVESSPPASVSEDLPPSSASRDRDASSELPTATVDEETPRAPKRLLTKQKSSPDALSSMQANESGGLDLPSSQRQVPVTPGRNRAMTTPSGPLPVPSSVYSSENISSSFKNRTQSSPPDLSHSPEGSRRDSQTTTHLVWPTRRSMHVRATTTPERPAVGNDRDETTTTDLRLSSYRHPMQMHYLPDLKEESHEDSSLNTSASNLKNSTFRFPHGQPSVRASVEDTMLLRNPSFRSARNSALVQPRGGRLPSMNFSGLDLTADLDHFFEPRTTRSFEASDREDVLRGVALRSASDGKMRDKYRSVFAGLGGSDESGAGAQTGMSVSEARRKTREELMADIENLDVPSVTGLTMRISELLPKLKDADRTEFGSREDFIIQEEEIIGHVREELQEVGVPAQKRSNARLRPVPGSPNMLVVDDAVYEELTGREKETGGSAHDGPKGGQSSGRVNEGEEAPVAELEAPCGVKLRPRSLSLGERPSSRQSVIRSQLSLPSTPTASTETHPWYNDGNFPWAETAIPSVDISLPRADAAHKSPPRPGPSPLRLRVSQSSEGRLSSHSNNPRASAAARSTDGTADARTSRLLTRSRDQKLHRASTASPPPRFDNNGFLLGPIDVRSGDQSHEAGDRYPTSSLSPPSNVNLHALTQQAPSRLSDSDDEILSPRNRKLSLLRRLTSSRTPASASTDSRAFSAPATDTLRRPPAHQRRLTYTDASGLTSKEYHMAKFTDTIKEKWARLKGKCCRVFGGSRGIREIPQTRHSRFPPVMPGERPTPDDVLEARGRMPESFYEYGTMTPPAPRRKFRLWPARK